MPLKKIKVTDPKAVGSSKRLQSGPPAHSRPHRNAGRASSSGHGRAGSRRIRRTAHEGRHRR